MANRFEWQWNFKILLFTAVFLPLTVSLGFWQLERADEKRLLLAQQQQQQQMDPVPLPPPPASSQYLNVSVQAVPEAGLPVLLLDNRVRQGRPGYEVISVTVTKTGARLLVNRGWIAGSVDRTILPAVPGFGGAVALKGYLYQSPGRQVMLGGDDWAPGSDRVVIQNAAPEQVASKLGLELYPYTLRLDADSPGALGVGWGIVNVQPEKHVGYAVQWFLMALALVVLTVFANSNLGAIRRRKEDSK